MNKVKFLNVGRNKASWEAHFDDELTHEFLYQQVKSKGVMSNDLIFTRLVSSAEGTIFAGLRPIGSYEVSDGEE